ncbi:hypothetical protein VPH35_015209 [Triticum aestivum]
MLRIFLKKLVGKSRQNMAEMRAATFVSQANPESSVQSTLPKEKHLSVYPPLLLLPGLGGGAGGRRPEKRSGGQALPFLYLSIQPSLVCSVRARREGGGDGDLGGSAMAPSPLSAREGVEPDPAGASHSSTTATTQSSFACLMG